MKMEKSIKHKKQRIIKYPEGGHSTIRWLFFQYKDGHISPPLQNL